MKSGSRSPPNIIGVADDENQVLVTDETPPLRTPSAQVLLGVPCGKCGLLAIGVCAVLGAGAIAACAVLGANAIAVRAVLGAGGPAQAAAAHAGNANDDFLKATLDALLGGTAERGTAEQKQLDSFLHLATWRNQSLGRYETLVREMEQEVPYNGIFEGHSGEIANALQQRFYQGLARLPFVSVVCEIGFNGGHSSANWLSAKPGVKLFSFDLGEHEYTRPRAAFLMQRYPGQITITYGDSGSTVPVFHRENPGVHCDVVVVDGGHTTEQATRDVEAMRYLANRHFHVFVMDDISCEETPRAKDQGWCLGPEAAIERAEQRGHLRMLEMFNLWQTRGFGLGQYVFH